jgi:UDP-N-acetylmuramoyl-tripeptide--D-alanyl-D-alanine ligase
MKSLIRRIITKIIETEAKFVLRKYHPKIIAVTGSVGKTSTKDAIFAVLGETLVARKSAKSFNSEIGLPLTILGCDNAWSNVFQWLKNIFTGLAMLATRVHYPKWLVLEIGADKPGDIARATSWVTPDIAVITCFGDVPVHVEAFKTPEEVFEEKTNLAKAVRSSGVVILNADDARVLAIRDKIKAKIITFGTSESAMFRATNIRILYQTNVEGEKVPAGMTFKLEYDGNVFPVNIPGVLGTQPVYSVLAALAAGVYLKINIVDMIGKLSSHESAPGRMHLLPGIKGTTIIDDTYNSSPVAAMAAVRALQNIETSGKRIAVLGDMLELGKFSMDEHKKLGAFAGSFADIILAVGPRAKYIVEGAIEGDMNEKNIIEFDNAQPAGKYLESVLNPGDIVLIKGSQGMRMERAVEEIMAHPENAAELLVRQDEEWKKR